VEVRDPRGANRGIQPGWTYYAIPGRGVFVGSASAEVIRDEVMEKTGEDEVECEGFNDLVTAEAWRRSRETQDDFRLNPTYLLLWDNAHMVCVGKGELEQAMTDQSGAIVQAFSHEIWALKEAAALEEMEGSAPVGERAEGAVAVRESGKFHGLSAPDDEPAPSGEPSTQAARKDKRGGGGGRGKGGKGGRGGGGSKGGRGQGAVQDAALGEPGSSSGEPTQAPPPAHPHATRGKRGATGGARGSG
jgi:hypothetical protein